MMLIKAWSSSSSLSVEKSDVPKYSSPSGKGGGGGGTSISLGGIGGGEFLEEDGSVGREEKEAGKEEGH